MFEHGHLPLDSPLRTLALHQRAFLDQFLAMAPQRALLVAPLGMGRAHVSGLIADLLSTEGPVLVVTPAPFVAFWSDLIRGFQQDHGRDEASVEVLNRTSLGALQGSGGPTASAAIRVAVVAADRIATWQLTSLLATIRWRLVLLDEVGWLLAEPSQAHLVTSLLAGDRATLAIASPDARTEVLLAAGLSMTVWDSGARTGSLGTRAGMLPARVVAVDPSSSEERYIAGLEAWVAASKLPPATANWLVRLGLIDPFASATVLERLSAPERPEELFSPDEALAPAVLPAEVSERAEISALISWADQIEPPGSRIQTCVRILRKPVERQATMVMASLEQVLPRLGEALIMVGIRPEIVAPNMEPDERLSAARRARADNGVLLASDKAASVPLSRGFERIVHFDVGLDLATWRLRRSISENGWTWEDHPDIEVLLQREEERILGLRGLAERGLHRASGPQPERRKASHGAL